MKRNISEVKKLLQKLCEIEDEILKYNEKTISEAIDELDEEQISAKNSCLIFALCAVVNKLIY